MIFSDKYRVEQIPQPPPAFHPSALTPVYVCKEWKLYLGIAMNNDRSESGEKRESQFKRSSLQMTSRRQKPSRKLYKTKRKKVSLFSLISKTRIDIAAN